ncbi:MAG: redoxin family protein [bacterium]|nr:redoxin family protein [bacterium]
MKKTATILTVLLIALGFTIHLFPGERDIIRQTETLVKKKQLGKALETVNKGLKEFPESERMWAAKAGVLVKLDRLEDAAAAAKKRVDVAPRKSPWHCIAVASVYIKMKKNENAFLWLEKAVDRGWLNYAALYDEEEFKTLKKDKRLDALVTKIKANIGIGKPAKDFTVKLLNSEKSFTLSKHKGKVILVDFWATWCPPCVKGIPYLKKYYKQFKNKGFEIIGVSLDSKIQKVIDYVAKEKVEWVTTCSGKAWMDPLARQYKVNLIPSYWLIDRNGILRDFGYHLRDKETMKKAIEKLVSQ